MFAAFSFFDKDGSGYITKDELQQACEQFGFQESQIEEIIREVDQDNVYCSFYSFLIFQTTTSSVAILPFFFCFDSGWSDRLQRIRRYDGRHWFRY